MAQATKVKSLRRSTWPNSGTFRACLYAKTTSTEWAPPSVARLTQYFTRGDKISGIQANGMDVIASAQAVKHAREWVVSGKGPLLFEFVTYRYGGHSCVSSALR